MQPCTKSDDGRHNFNPHTGDCMWGCGVNQRGIKPIQKTSLFEQGMARIMTPQKPKRGIHTELQDLVAQLIEEYDEPPYIMVGGRKVKTFGYYIGKLSRVPLSTIYMWRASVKQGRDITNKGKVFWWYYREWRKGITKKK